ncbi:putative protein S-acyltransferase [Dioscorea sansibarensis]
MHSQERNHSSLLLPLVTTIVVILNLYYTTVFVMIVDWIELSSPAGFTTAILFSGLAVMTVITYIMAIFSDPECVPSSNKPDLEDPKLPLHEVMKKL